MNIFTGAVIYDLECIDALPVGTIIAWGEDEDEEIAILRHRDERPVGVHNTYSYWITESWVVGLPFRIVRFGTGKGAP